MHPHSVTQWPWQPGLGQPGVCQGPAVPGRSSLWAGVRGSPCRGHAALLRVKSGDDSAKEHHPPHPFWGHRGCPCRETCLQRQARPCSCHRGFCCSGHRDPGWGAGGCRRGTAGSGLRDIWEGKRKAMPVCEQQLAPLPHPLKITGSLGPRTHPLPTAAGSLGLRLPRRTDG